MDRANGSIMYQLYIYIYINDYIWIGQISLFMIDIH